MGLVLLENVVPLVFDRQTLLMEHEEALWQLEVNDDRKETAEVCLEALSSDATSSISYLIINSVFAAGRGRANAAR